MEVLIAAVAVLPLLGLMICVLKKKRHHESEDGDFAAVFRLLVCNITVMLTGMLVCGAKGEMLLFDLVLSMIPAVLAVFHVFGDLDLRRVVFASGVSAFFVVCGHIVYALGYIPPLLSFSLTSVSVVMLFVLCFVVALNTILRMRNAPKAMKSYSLWSYLWLCSDFVYLTVISFAMVLAAASVALSSAWRMPLVSVADILLISVLVGLYVRKIRNSPFVIMLRREKIVLESMKVSHLAILPSSDTEDSCYKEVYDRLTAYFEEEKPFLRSDLTINDLVKVIYSNKLYISRAVSLFTGRNFRQFVNYYRVRYSCDMYRENPEMKIVELSQACGFNTVASFNMAFRLFMKQTPGEWCRREKVRMGVSDALSLDEPGLTVRDIPINSLRPGLEPA